jgi:hypothetical protein
MAARNRKYLKTSLTEAEYAEIQQMADAEGLSISTFTRVALARAVHGPDTAQAIRAAQGRSTKASADIWDDVREILGHVRQLVRQLHRQEKTPGEEDASC